MKSKILRSFCLSALVGGAAISTGVLTQGSPIEAQTAPQKKIIQLKPATVRTPEAMALDSAKSVEAAPQPIPVRPGMDPEKYRQLKDEVNVRLSPAASRLSPHSSPLVSLGGVNCEGPSATEGLRPSDIHSAVGTTQFVTVTNSRINVYTKSTTCDTPTNNTLQKSTTLNAFIGYSGSGGALFDPRVMYDSTYKRWIVTAEARKESDPTVQPYFIAVSKTNDAAGAYFIYQLDVSFAFNNNDFWDYPQLGQNQDAILVTANICPTGCNRSNMLSIAKARLYNGLGFSIPVFTNLQVSLAPPIVLDQSNRAFFASALSSGTSVQLYRLENASNAFEATLAGPFNVPVSSYSLPPDASQPGTSVLLDTLDARFVNASTQLGNSLWNVHSVAFGPSAPRFYEINTSTNALKQSGAFFASGNSHDWNASITVNPQNTNAFVNWSSTNPGVGTNAQVRASSCSVSSCSPGAGLAFFTSPTFYTGFGLNPERWGDYSAITIDPSNTTRAWLANQKNNSNSIWGTRYGNIAP